MTRNNTRREYRRLLRKLRAWQNFKRGARALTRTEENRYYRLAAMFE